MHTQTYVYIYTHVLGGVCVWFLGLGLRRDFFAHGSCGTQYIAYRKLQKPPMQPWEHTAFSVFLGVNF